LSDCWVPTFNGTTLLTGKAGPTTSAAALGPARLGLPKETIGFVSSNCWDVVGAKAYGFPVAWVNRLGAPLEELGVAPDLEVADLAELARALGR
jgi:2-haloacid dehalogenase